MAEEKASERVRVVTWDDPLEAMMEARKVSGAEFFEKLRMGELAPPPYALLLGMDAFDQGEGEFTMTMQPQEFHYNPMGCVHGGILSTLLDSVMSAAVHTKLGVGQGYLTLNITVNFVKPVYKRTGAVMAVGKVVSMGKQIATAEGRIFGKGELLYATGTASCLIFGPAGEKKARPEGV